MDFIKQNKGKALEKVSLKARSSEADYYCSIKRDGQMVQIAFDKPSDTVRMWSSNGHEFYNTTLANWIKDTQDYSFHIEAEYTGTSDGLMGDRGKSSKITTYRTEFAKGIQSEGSINERFWVFDILSFDTEDVRNDPFSSRYGYLCQLTYCHQFAFVEQTAGFSIESGLAQLELKLQDGYEGVMLTRASHIVKTSGRSNDRLKLKATPTLYATIIGFTPGKDDREDTIGSLTVRDEDGLEFSAGTGLNANEWSLNPNDLLGIEVKIGYESIKDGNYQQPRYIGVGKDCLHLNEYLSQND